MGEKVAVSAAQKSSRCYSCRYLRREYESWEMEHIWWWECAKRPANAMLSTFPFKNGCKQWEGMNPNAD